MPITIAYLNCYNLYDVGAHTRRGPKISRTLGRKLANLAKTIRNACGNASPDVVALSEVGSENVGRLIAQAIEPDTYNIEWSGA